MVDLDMKNITVGIIGCGVIAPTHIEKYKVSEDVQVKWACDLLDERSQAVADSYDIPHTTADYHDLLSDPEVDAISICTDHKSHAAIAIDALHAGKHILCEKPLASSPEDLQAMLVAQKECPEIVFAAVFQHRFDELYRFIREKIATGAFGTITAVNLVSFLKRTDKYYSADSWRGTWELEGGSLIINQSIHYIDLVLWLFGDVAAVCAKYDNITHGDSIETEDTVSIIVRFKSGVLGSMMATSSSSEGWRNEISISGTEGYMRMNCAVVDECKFSSPSEQSRVEKGLQACTDQKKIAANKSYYGDGHTEQIGDFINAIREKRSPYVTVESAASTVKFIHACYESSRTGQWVEL